MRFRLNYGKIPAMIGVVAQRIRRRLDELGMSARKASLEAKLGPDAVRNILSGKSQHPRHDTLQKLTEPLDCTLDYLLGQASAPGGTGNLRKSEHLVYAPLISWVQAGKLHDPVDPYQPGDAEDWLPVDYRRSTVIALRVEGSSMDRIAPAGTVIVCDFEDRQPIDGKFYVVKIGEEITFKRYRANPDRFEPYSFGTDHETIFPDDSAEIVGRVVLVSREV